MLFSVLSPKAGQSLGTLIGDTADALQRRGRLRDQHGSHRHARHLLDLPERVHRVVSGQSTVEQTPDRSHRLMA